MSNGRFKKSKKSAPKPVKTKRFAKATKEELKNLRQQIKKRKK